MPLYGRMIAYVPSYGNVTLSEGQGCLDWFQIEEFNSVYYQPILKEIDSYTPEPKQYPEYTKKVFAFSDYCDLKWRSRSFKLTSICRVR